MPALACSIPAAPPPVGVKSNFVNPDSDAIYVLTTTFALLAASIVLVALRIYTRVRLLKSVGVDDYMIVLALMSCAASTAAVKVQTKFGLGKHGWDVRLSDFSPNFLKLLTVSVMTYFSAIFFTKLSLLFMYRRSLSTTKLHQMTWWGTLALVVMYNVPCSIILILGCRPINALWDINLLKHAKCINPFITILIQGAFNAVTDILILVLAILLLRTLRVTKQQRLVLIVLFIIGSLTSVISVYRISKFLPPVKRIYMVDDFTYEAVAPTIWSLVEVNSGIICSCIITLRPLLREYYNSQFPGEIAEADDYVNTRQFTVWKQA